MKLQNLLMIIAGLLGFCGISPDAFAQGRIKFINDSLHLVYFNNDPDLLLPQDYAWAGLATPSGGVTASGVTLVADLWGGTSSTSLALLATTTFAVGVQGTLSADNFVTTPFGAGVTAFFQVQVYDAAMGSYAGAVAAWGHYFGESPVFTTVTSVNFAGNSIVNAQSPAFSTWANGTQDESISLYGPGALGAIAIQAAPEPTTLALAGMGAVALMIFRRRK